MPYSREKMSEEELVGVSPGMDGLYNRLLPGEGKTFLQWFFDKYVRKEMLIWWTLLGVVVGLAVGGGLYNANVSKLMITLIGYPGELMIRALQELVLPLIVLALMVGVLNLRHTSGGIRRIIRWSLSYYVLSMLLAVGLGITLVELIQPGAHTNFDNTDAASCDGKNTTSYQGIKGSSGVVESLLDIGRDFIPTNIVAAAANTNFLGIIVFAVVVASAISSFGEEAEPVIHFIEFGNNVILEIIKVVIAFTPVGVASLIASTILTACNLAGLVKALSLYVAVVLAGLLIHSLVVLPSVMLILSGRNPYKAARAFMPALVMGFGTSSSAATMPVTMRNAEEYGCAPSLVKFMVPLGTNLNRDGAALYEAVSVIFILQAHGIPMTAGQLMVVVITSTLAAVGAASIPNGALVTMITVLQALGYPEFTSNVAVLYAVDWFLGMIRTSVNIWGDACAVVIVDELASTYGT